MRVAPATIASRWAASIAAAGGADDSGVMVAGAAEHQVTEQLADSEQAQQAPWCARLRDGGGQRTCGGSEDGKQ